MHEPQLNEISALLKGLGLGLLESAKNQLLLATSR